MRDCTDITVILDRSGSMSAVKEAMEEVLNGFVAQQKLVPGDCRLTLVQFSDERQTVFSGLPLKNVPIIYLTPAGSTALLDAVGYTVDETGARFAALPECERPDKVVFVVVTDGYENASRKFEYREIQDKVMHQRNAYKWQFVFLGADQDAIASAASMGFAKTSALNYRNTKGSVRGMGAKLSDSTKQYRLCSANNYDETLTAGGVAVNVTEEDTKAWDKQQAEVKAQEQK